MKWLLRHLLRSRRGKFHRIPKRDMNVVNCSGLHVSPVSDIWQISSNAAREWNLNLGWKARLKRNELEWSERDWN